MIYPLNFKRTSLSPQKKIEINIYNNKNRLQIIRLETILGYMIKNYNIYIKKNVGVIEFQHPTSFKLQYKIIPPLIE